MDIIFTNIYTKGDLSIEIKHKDRTLVFSVKPILLRTAKALLIDPNQYQLLTDYWEYVNATEYVMDLYSDIYDLTMEEITIKPSDRFSELVTRLANTIDYETALKFVHGRKNIKPPKNLIVKFDPVIEQNKLGTKAKTYLKSEYMELVTMIMTSKALLPVLGNVASINTQAVLSDRVTLSLFNYIKSSNVFKTPPNDKLIGFVMENTHYRRSSDMLAAIAYKHEISVSDLPDAVLANVFIKTLSIIVVENDDVSKNAITIVYKGIDNFLNKDNDFKESLSVKEPSMDEDGKESVFESFRESTDITIGQGCEFNFVLRHPITALSTMLELASEVEEVYYDARDFISVLYESDIEKSTLDIVGLVIHELIDVRAMKYLNRTEMLNAIAIAFTYLWIKGHRELALIISSHVEDRDSTAIVYGANRKGMSRENKEVLAKIYSVTELIYTRRVFEEKNTILEDIDNVLGEFYKHNLVYLATSKYLGDRSVFVDVPRNMRDLIAELLIDIKGK